MVTRRQMLKATGAAAAVGLVGGCTAGEDAEAVPADQVAAGGSDAGAPGADASGVPPSLSGPPLTYTGPDQTTGLNVILIVVDTLRRDHVGVFGGNTKTPSIDALAADGVRFPRFHPEAMPTIPVRRTIHSGMRTFPASDWMPVKGNAPLLLGWQHIPDAQPTMAEMFAHAGYATAIVADTPHMFKANMNFSRGFQTYRWVRGHQGDFYRPAALADPKRLSGLLIDPIGNRGGLVKAYVANTDGRQREEQYQGPKVFGEAMTYMREAKDLRPFFLVVDSFDPHEPWDPPQSYIKQYGEATFDGLEPVAPGYGSAEDWADQKILDRMGVLYNASITMTDAWIGKFLDEMDSLGALDNTMVVFLSDHGILLGEHGLTGKPPSQSMWPEITDVPLVIRHPDGPKGTESMAFASTHDLAPTILAAAGITPAAELDGLDLSGLVSSSDGGDDGVRDHISAMYDTNYTVRSDQYMFVTNADGSDRKLFDMEAAPGATVEVTNEQGDELERHWQLLLDDAGGALPVWDKEAIDEVLGNPPTTQEAAS